MPRRQRSTSTTTDLIGARHSGLAEAGAALDASIWNWIGAMLSGSPTSKSGAILMMDGDYSLTHRLEFRDAYISEVPFPQSDGASKDAAFLTIGIAPERTEFKVAGGAGIASDPRCVVRRG